MPRDGAPRRDPVAVPSGTASIAGQLNIAGASEPLRRARVTLRSPSLAEAHIVDSDTAGRFRFDRLPPGEYRLLVEKPGFLSLEYGARWPFVQPPPIELASGQALTAEMFVPRGAAIEGRLVNESGMPMVDATVSAVRLMYTATGRRPQAIGQATTDDRGQYRLHSLPPGDYQVSAVGSWRAERPAVSSGSDIRDYARMYYPGTARLQDAQRISLTVGQEVTGIDFSVSPVPIGQVTLRLTDSREQTPATMRARMTLVGRPGESVRMMWAPSNPGVFEFPQVQPGEYWLTAVSGVGDEAEALVAKVAVPSGPQTLSLRTAAGVAIEGRVELEGGGSEAWRSGLTVVPHVLEYDFSSSSGDPLDPQAVAVGADGRFTFRSLVGSRVFRVNGLPPGWGLKGVWLDGTDVTDSHVELAPGAPMRTLRVVVTARTSTLRGSVVDAAGSAVADARVVVFAEDERQWARPSRFIRAAQTSRDGRFSIDSLLPGRYRISALSYIEDAAWLDADVLQALKASATPVTLGEGESPSLSLVVRGAP